MVPLTSTDHFALAQELALLLNQHRLKLAVAESCTGGGLAYQLTAVPGCSEWFDRGFVTYSNLAKQEMLGVSPNTISVYGAVSAQTAEEMCKNVLKFSIADISLSVTGIAGPGGGSAEKPVGLVWFGLAHKQGKAATRFAQLAAGREQIRHDAIGLALSWLTDEIKEEYHGKTE